MGDRPLTEDEQKKLADLKGLRLTFRKDARSGNPAKRGEALKRATTKAVGSEPEGGESR